MTEKKKTASSRKIEQDLFMEEKKPVAAKKPGTGKTFAAKKAGTTASKTSTGAKKTSTAAAASKRTARPSAGAQRTGDAQPFGHVLHADPQRQHEGGKKSAARKRHADGHALGNIMQRHRRI